MHNRQDPLDAASAFSNEALDDNPRGSLLTAAGAAGEIDSFDEQLRAMGKSDIRLRELQKIFGPARLWLAGGRWPHVDESWLGEAVAVVMSDGADGDCAHPLVEADCGAVLLHDVESDGAVERACSVAVRMRSRPAPAPR